jgi:hypothetical protein
MMKILRKALLCLLIIALLPFSGFSVNNAVNSNIASAIVWSAPNTEKIMQDRHLYDDIKREAKITVSAAKNEYESAQIIITPQANVKSYDVELSDLTLKTDSSVKYSVNNIQVFKQKYITVSKITTTIAVPTGNYPDALLPFDVAKEYGENTIEAGKNQGIFYIFYIPMDQQPGLYEGTFKLEIDKTKVDIPVQLEVWDFAVKDGISSKSLFRANIYFQNGELNTTQEMLDKYNEALIQFRLAPEQLMVDNQHTDDDIATYTEIAYRYAINPMCSNIYLPFKSIPQGGDRNIDADVMEKYLKSFANKSFETNFNMLEKTVAYITMIDEPYLHQTWDRTNIVCQTFDDTLEKVASDLEADTSITSPIKDEVIASIRGIKNVVTSKYEDIIAGTVKTWCPKVSDYDTPEARAHYDDQEEKWWYTCTNPKNPYPSYHIDDVLISSRIMGWMQAKYNVVGNLYWAVTLYAAYRNNDYVYIEDYFQTADRYPTANGDGFLFYPGAQYGLDEPIISIRLNSIRDGYEEYELLLDLNEQYRNISKKFDGTENNASEKILDRIYNTLFNGTRVSTTATLFESARQNLAQLITLANSPAEAIITDVEVSETQATYTVVVKDGFDLKSDGQVVTDYTLKNNYREYKVTKQFSNQNNYLNISVNVNGKELEFRQYLGGAIHVYTAEDIFNDTVVADNGSKTLVNANTVIFQDSGKMIKVSFPNNIGQRKTHNIKFSGDFTNQIGSNTDKLQIVVYNSTGEQINYSVRFKYETKSLYYVVKTGKLEEGLNVISVENLFGYYWDDYKALEHMLLYVGNEGDGARDIYIKGISVFML